ncbi:hydrogen gas-evolving membrane-bound hydrogenase subunit E [Pseudochelatococcus contaminans]|uniref:Multicomponent Na+:H+ antiporter subunit A n=1 Tax=Pseudochelatococcus contaminans TaxID=1538103 RepID=A0A7W6EHE1_9HYPH|nr:hydrogen gas-evolving membrane-bound hydrogenase subunit E [Pseudochelatococcus contaminans]MBB3810094.1 multicomponent Na+:H+ antiporter subunit A [Pseudochelatococcus contaminans]
MILLALVMFAFALAPFVGAIGGRSSPFVAIIPLLLFVAFCVLLPEIAEGGTLLETHRWIPSIGIAAAFRLDGLSLTFALLISGIGCAVFLYASAYLRGEPRLVRFYTIITLFMASMLGAVLADDLVLLVVFWELTSITSFLLIGHTPEQERSRRSAQQGFLVTVAGGLAMLAGVILLGSVADTFSITEILGKGEMIAADPLAPAIIILIAAGAFAKSAQAPLHSWLANAMVAPTPVSAYLHSATMVKLGVYLLARFDPVFSDHALWIALLTGFGAATMLTGSVLAMRETDLKRVLAYSTIVSLGTLIMLIGIPGELAAVAVVTFLIVHALYKACLFLVAGIIDHETGTRDSSALGGMRHFMPITAAVALMGGLSMAGLPPSIGFAAKELVYETGLAASAGWALVAVALLANAAMVVVAAVVAVRCFSGDLSATPKTPHDPGFAMLAGPIVLALLGLLFGIAPWLVGNGLIVPAASAIAGEPITFTLSLWHGFTPMLALSVLTLVLGVFAYRRWSTIRSRMAGIHQIDDWGPDKLYDRLIIGLQSVSTWVTHQIQPGSLRSYVARTLFIMSLAAFVTLILRGGYELPSFANSLGPDLVIAILLIVSSLAVARARNFVSGIVAAGMVGFTVALLFLFQGAPDLAFTQFSVEALAIIIMLAIVGRMPFRDRDSRIHKERLRDLFIAGGTGVTAALVLLAVLAQPFDGRLSDFFRAASVPEAHGRNLVNVILVDFRALDTLGEITVLGLAAIAAAAVLAGLRRATAEKSK